MSIDNRMCRLWAISVSSKKISEEYLEKVDLNGNNPWNHDLIDYALEAGQKIAESKLILSACVPEKHNLCSDCEYMHLRKNK